MFWNKLEEELDEHAEDLKQVKAVFTVMGYRTKLSVAAIKSAKKVSDLEVEFMKIKAHPDTIARFPELKTVDFFTPGMKSMMIDIATHFNRQKDASRSLSENPQDTHEKLLAQAKKVCETLCEANVIVEQKTSGLQCKIICPKCNSMQKLSSYVNYSTGKRTFSINNYVRHHNWHKLMDRSAASPTTEKDNQQETLNYDDHETSFHMEKNCNDCQKLKQLLAEKNQELKNVNQNRETKEVLSTDYTELKMANFALNQKLIEKNLEITTLESQVTSMNKHQLVISRLTSEKHALVEQMKTIEVQHSKKGEKGAENSKQDCIECKNMKTLLNEKVDEFEKNRGMYEANLKEQKIQIETLENELNLLRKQHTKKHTMFSVNLCSFEAIDSDIVNIGKNGVVTFTDCQRRNCFLYFNEIHIGVTAEVMFNGLKPYLKLFIDGKTVSIITHGTTGSGKSCTMFGFGNEAGILRRSASEILKHGPLVLSAIEITCKESFDLITGIKIPMEKLAPVTEDVQSTDEFDQIVQQVLALRIQKSTDQNSTSSRSHLIFKISIKGKSNCIVFGDLAGFENGRNKENISETQFINSSLSGLNQVMLSLARNQVPNFKANNLTSFLQPFLNSNTLMLYHVSKNSLKTGLETMKDIVASQKGTKRSTGTQQKASLEPIAKVLKLSALKPTFTSGRHHIR